MGGLVLDGSCHDLYLMYGARLILMDARQTGSVQCRLKNGKLLAEHFYK